jgi:hypothetical protein
MDVGPLLGSIAAGLLGVFGGGYAIWRKINRDFAADGAERFANDWHQKVIARQDQEADRLRAEIAALRAVNTDNQRRILEVEQRERAKEKVIRDIIKDIRLVKREEITVGQLNTGLIDDL